MRSVPAAVEVGKVIDTSIYPVKGMRGVSMDQITLRSVSVAGDRTRAFIMPDATQTPNVLDTIRFPGLLRYAPFLESPDDPRKSLVNVQAPDGNTYSADDESIMKEISDACGERLALIRMGRGMYHSMPVSVASMGSLRAIAAIVGFDVDPRRFRENVWIETLSGEPFVEDEWIGSVLQFGDRDDSAAIKIMKLDPRCKTIDLDPETGEYHPGVLRAVARERRGNLGVYANVHKEGTISRGDTIYVRPNGSAV